MPTIDLMNPSPDIVQVSPDGGSLGMTSGRTLDHISAGYGNFASGYNWTNVYQDPQNITEGNPYYEGNMPTQEQVYQEHGINHDLGNDGLHQEKDDNNVKEDYSTGASLSEFLQQNPGATYEQAMQYMAQYSDEWAEKLLDYYAEKDSLREANEYTAQREDTAYQRLVADLKAAGLNPAMMYSHGTSPVSPSGSQGYLKLSEGANSRGISNYSKVQNVLLAYMMYQLKKGLGITNAVFDGIGTIGDLITSIIGLGKKR